MPDPASPRADERSDRVVGTASRRSAATPLRTDAADAVLRDVQSLLGGVVQRLWDGLGCESVVAWALREDGEPYIAAAAFEGAPPAAPDADIYAAAAALSVATDLTQPDAAPALAPLARSHGAAAVPIAPGEAGPLAVLLLTAREAGPVRPRILGLLDATARRVAGPLAASRAVSRLRRLDDEVRRLDRLASLGTLAAEIAHEVRNPLVSVKTFLPLLPERGDDPEFTTRFLKVASEELQRMERLLELVIDYPRGRDQQERSSASAALAMVEELLGHLTRGRGIELEVKRGARLPDVAVTEDGLRQALLNLALNAIEATPEGGTVRLSGARVRGGVELRVADQGPGIPEEECDRVFEPFHSTRPDGHGGIGLAVTRRIVEEAGGTIQIGKAADGGAEFRVWLPAAAGAESRPR
jgi:two-component system sensor histidine kinase HydH